MNRGVIIGIVVVLVLIVIIAVVVGVVLSKKSAQNSESSTSSVSSTSSDSSLSLVDAVANSVKSADDKIVTPSNLPALATPPTVSNSGATVQFVQLTASQVPKSTTTGTPAPMPKGTAWVGQQITTNTGKTITVPILVPTTAPKQNIVTKGLDGKPLGPTPKGMVWVKKTFTKGGKTASTIVLEKKL